MEDRDYDDAADEFEELNFYQTISRFAECFSHLSQGELMALRSRFVQLAYLEHEPEDDERKTANLIAEAIEEVIVFKLKANPDGLDKYFRARNSELEYVKDYGIGTVAYDILRAGNEPPESPPEKLEVAPTSAGLFKWLSKK